MRAKKIAVLTSIILLFSLILGQLNGLVYAKENKISMRLLGPILKAEREAFLPLKGIGDVASFDFTLSADKTELQRGEEVVVTASVKDFENVEDGIYALGGIIGFDKDVFEVVKDKVKGLNTWSFSANDYNLDNFKFVAVTNNASLENLEVLTITFKVKEDAEFGDTKIYTEDITGGTGKMENGIIDAEKTSIVISVKAPDEPVVEDITSDVYEVNKEEKTISKIPFKTTVAEFKSNVETEQEMVFTSKDGKVLSDEDVIENGANLKVGETLEFTLIVDEEPEPPVEENITSDVYEINKEEKIISKIPFKTTVAEFKSNVETEQEMVFTSKDGKVLSDEDVIEDGANLKVGETLEFTLIVDEEPEPPVEEKYIKSNVYEIEENEIENITTNTTVADFIKNVETNLKEIKFVNQKGEELKEDECVGTGVILKAEDGFEYTLIVTGDLDGDGKIGINDIAKIKLHYIEREELEGIYLTAAKMDSDDKVTINDIAKMKLIYVEKEAEKE